MTDDKIALRQMLGTVSDASFLHEMIGFAAQRLMQLEVGEVTGAADGGRSADRLVQRNGYRDRDWQTRIGTVKLPRPSAGGGDSGRHLGALRKRPDARRSAAPIRKWLDVFAAPVEPHGCFAIV